MEKANFDKYKVKPKDTKVCRTHWQEYARNVCKEFSITGKWSVMIFQKAKNQMPDLKSKVEYCNEKGIKNGRYLIACFRK